MLNFILFIIFLIAVNCILSLSLNLIAGYTGLLSLCHAAFMAIGAYTTAIITTKFQIDFIFVLIISGFLASLFGILIGLPTLRLKGDYLAIATLGFNEIIRNVITNSDPLTRGANGIHGIPTPQILFIKFPERTLRAYTKLPYIALALFFVIITFLFIKKLIKSRFGRALEAIREDEIAAKSMGINTTKYKVFSFAIGAFFAGIAGSIYAGYIQAISPGYFTFLISVMILCMVVLGGLGNSLASLIGALIIVLAANLPSLIKTIVNYNIPAEFNQIIFGLILVLMMLFRPQGILGRKKPDYEKILRRSFKLK